ncbi:unnamed protein product [Amoebophrya sp. A25]|nr:unnamed protein product [Amoebophrya sp. A25]|eukprot:GSA25T00004583001.1
MDGFREFRDVKDFLKGNGAQIPDDVTTVLLGECTHGTHEFYQLRAEITKYLIEFKKFTCVLCESDWTFMWHMNQYVHRKKSKMFPDSIRFPDWMWKNEPFHDLVEWMRRRASSDGPYLFGLDCYCREESKEECLKFFDFHDREGLGKDFRKTLYPRERPDLWPQILSKLQWEIGEDDKKNKILQSSLSRKGSSCIFFSFRLELECQFFSSCSPVAASLQSSFLPTNFIDKDEKPQQRSSSATIATTMNLNYTTTSSITALGDRTTADGSRGGVLLSSSKFRGCSKLDQFNAEQNLECMIAADEYYSKQRLEPPGSRASWNARDQHMMTTIMRLKANSQELFGIPENELKVVVWAHNSHVGDATATPMGGENFLRNEKWNLGQMCRSTLENVFIVGFYSYHGEVRAAHKWGADGQVMKLQKGLPASLEACLHMRFKGKQGYFAAGSFISEDTEAPSGSALARARSSQRNSRAAKKSKPSSGSSGGVVVGTSAASSSSVSCDYAPGPLQVPYRCVHTEVYATPDVQPPGRGSEEGSAAKRRKLDPSVPFVGVKRQTIEGTQRSLAQVRLQIQNYDSAGALDGWWVTEAYPGRDAVRRTSQIQCLPVSTIDKLEGGKQPFTSEGCALLSNHPLLQRWVGVQYHPETEFSSHYGEMCVGRCYDLIVFVDKTNALSVKIPERVPVADQLREEQRSSAGGTENNPSSSAAPPAVVGSFAGTIKNIKEAMKPSRTMSEEAGASSASSSSQKKQLTAEQESGQVNKRLLTEFRRILKNPIEYIDARPLETNLLEWHFVISGVQDPYTGGKYHGILEFPPDFPMKPPSIKMLTPSGRFEINKRICLSMSDFHKESWNPAWTIEKILIGLMSYMYEETNESIGSILESKEDRRRYAKASSYFNAQNEIYVELFHAVEEEEQQEQLQKLRTLWKANEVAGDAGSAVSEKACRYCFVDTGVLVAPCECRGSTQWVHLQCLRQWQKSILVTQSTHPRYQTRIDEICNICDRPFKKEFQAPSRRDTILEYTGEDIPQLIVKGNLLVSSRPKSEKNFEIIEKHPDIADKLLHFTESVYLICLCEPYDPNKRGGGALLAINCANNRLLDRLPDRVNRALPGDRYEYFVSPKQKWDQDYKQTVDALVVLGILDPVEHRIGGPVEPAEAFGLIDLPALTDASLLQEKVDERDLVDYVTSCLLAQQDENGGDEFPVDEEVHLHAAGREVVYDASSSGRGRASRGGSLSGLLGGGGARKSSRSSLASGGASSTGKKRIQASLSTVLSIASSDPLSWQMAQKLRIKNTLFGGDLSLIIALICNVWARKKSRELRTSGTTTSTGTSSNINRGATAGATSSRSSTSTRTRSMNHDSETGSQIVGGLKLFWGYASWNATQLLGEIARRSWGLVVSSSDLSFQHWNRTLGEWEDLVDNSVVAKESEYAAY